MINKTHISFIVPVYNEEDNIDSFYAEISSVMKPLSDKYDWEFIFTDNHSEDDTFYKLAELSKLDEKIRVIRFSRNFGFQKSILYGYLNANGDVAIQIDCDLQDPPELIPKFIEYWEKGYKVVFGIREQRKEPLILEFFRKLFYRLIDFLSEDTLPRDAGDFRLIDRKIIENLRSMDDSTPYLRGAIATMGFSQIGIPHKRNVRLKGKSKFGYKELMQLAIDGVTNHSTVPLRLATYMGLSCFLLSLLGMLFIFFSKVFFGQDWPAGFAMIILILLFSLSINSFFLGILGEYLGRIYKQVKNGPLVIVEDTINIDKLK